MIAGWESLSLAQRMKMMLRLTHYLSFCSKVRYTFHNQRIRGEMLQRIDS
jgi:hypothetical protein